MYFQAEFPPEQFQQRRQRVMDDIGTDAAAVIGSAGGRKLLCYHAGRDNFYVRHQG